MYKLIDSDFKEILEVLLDISSQASNKILDIYNDKNFKVSSKCDSSPVTEADIVANEIIIQQLKKKFAKITVCSEESINNYNNLKTFFLVDPLDGTKEFISKNGEFTVNIGLVINNKPILGVVELPVKNLQYFSNGIESFIIKDKKRKKIKIRTNIRKVKIIASRSHMDKKTELFINKFDNYELNRKGSSLKICSIASGESDLYPRFGNTMEWDICAAHAILNSSGGRLTDLNLVDLRYGKKKLLNDSFIAFGNLNNEELKEKLKF